MNNFNAQKPGMISLLKRLVEIESPSHDKAAVDRVGALVAEECRRLGAQVEIHPQAGTGDHVLARFPKPRPLSQGKRGKSGILLLSHMDTVFPLGTLEKMPFCEKGDKIFGPGVLDMKGGIIIALTTLAALRETGSLPPRPISALFTSDEEIGSCTSRALIEGLAKGSALVLVLESGLPNGAVKTWRKGVGDFTVRVKGRAAHAGGDHEKGRNAIEELAHQVLVIQKLTDYEKGTTLNVGMIRGGTATNVVPAEAMAEVDLRVMQPSEAERILARLHALKPVLEGTSIEVTGELNRPPMPFDERMKATFERAKEIAVKRGISLQAGGSGGASDANFVAPLGIPVLDGLGAIGEDYHSEHEYILTDSLPERALLLAALLCEW
ncbi:MAG: M20 family metallopeptidase [Anaerolineales bacterium]|nr:M20 family metallopeptidase [Anaerolineales bacterium]